MQTNLIVISVMKCFSQGPDETYRNTLLRPNFKCSLCMPRLDKHSMPISLPIHKTNVEYVLRTLVI